MTDIDSAKKIVLGQFGKALNTDDVALGSTFVTDDFVWIYYEGSIIQKVELFVASRLPVRQ